MTLLKDGYLSQEELARLPGMPPAERLAKGPVAVIECPQEIPCNPCVEACRLNAITIEGSITNLPVLDSETCTGCGLCIAVCPGQAIFVVDTSYSEDESSVMIPYEFIPLPAEGEFVDGLDRAGRAVCTARVLKVRNLKRNDHTPLITLAVPKDKVMEVRSLRIRRGVL